MNDVKSRFPLVLVLRSFFVFWLLILSYFVFSNLSLTTKFLEQQQQPDNSQEVRAVENRLVELSETVSVMQIQVNRQQEQFASRQNEIQSLMQSFTTELYKYVLKTEIESLHVQIKAVQETTSQLKAEQTAKVALPSVAPAAKPPAKTAQAITQPPFNVIGMELRAGENLLSIMPTGNDAISAIRLIRPGQAVGAWTLQSIESGQAVFKMGSQVRRLTIPQ